MENNIDNKKIIDIQLRLINLLEDQINQLVLMSKIELGDDVIEEIKYLKSLIDG